MRINKGLKFLVVLLCMASLLSGCGTKNVTKSMNLEVGDMDRDSIIMLVGNTDVTYSEIMNYTYLLKKQYEGIYTDKLWDYKISNGTNLGDDAKQEIIYMITEIKIIVNEANKEDIELEVDEKDEALKIAEEIMKNVTDEEKEKYFLSVKSLSDLYEENILANKMYYVATDEADSIVSNKEAKQRDIQVIELITDGIDADGNVISMDEEEKAKTYEKIEKIRTEAETSDDFLSYAMKKSDRGEYEFVIGKDSDIFDEDVIEGAMELEEGQVSEVIEGDDGYYVLYCSKDTNEEATYEKKEEIIEKRQKSVFKKKLENWTNATRLQISGRFWDDFKIK